MMRPLQDRSLATRLSLYYVALFSVVGVQLPFWPLYLASKGLSASEIGLALAASYLVKIGTNPLVGQIADRRGGRRAPLIALAVASLVTTALFAFAQGFWPVLLVTLLSSAAYTAMQPLGDSLTLHCTLHHRLEYGRIRLWGSVSFIVIASLSGLWLVGAPRPAILWSSVAGLLATVATTVLLPDLRSPPARADAVSVRPLASNRCFQLFLLACSLGQASHMIYYGFATLHWRAAGLPGGVIGGLWAEGVIAEVILFAFGGRIVSRFGPTTLITAGALAGVLRWTVLGFTTDPVLLAAVQVLHAFTFASAHLGAMHFIARSTPPGLSARMQGIYSAITTGVISGLAMLAAGRLYQALEGHAFLVMSLLSLGGFVAAQALSRRWSGGLLVAEKKPALATGR
jgi:PPP family 3-phenylpropionic acid transporter